MAIIKTYHIAKSSSSQGFNFIFEKEKVSESIFNDLLKSKIIEMLGPERMDQYDKCMKDVAQALESKKPVTIVDRNFEIKFKNVKEK